MTSQTTPLSFVIGCTTIFLFLINTIIWCLVILVITPFKFVLPIPWVRLWIDRFLQLIASAWIKGNSGNIELFHRIHWVLDLPPDLSKDKSYLVVSNHISSVDIVVLQHVFNSRIPFLKFFLKSELIYVPLLGFAWWALGFPFMKRHSLEYLRKHPEKKGEDLRTTIEMCKKFKGQTMSIVNFAEGTRLTPKKHQKQNSPYECLLRPKAGGMAFAIEAMDNQFDQVLDVTLFYPQGFVGLWDLFSGNLKEVHMHVRARPVPQIQGSYAQDATARQEFHQWVAAMWKEKDAKLIALRTVFRA